MTAPEPDADPDWDLIQRVGRREAPAARELVAKKLPRLLSLATRLLGDRDEANDVAQEVFLRVWREAGKWQPGVARFDTWLHRVMLNLCYDRLRRLRRSDHPAPAVYGAQPGFDDHRDGFAADDGMLQGRDADDPAPRPEDVLAAKAERARIRTAIQALPTRQREALVLQYYQECGNVEAARIMGISVEALESLLARARRTLRATLDEPKAPGVSVKSKRTGPEQSGSDIGRQQDHDEFERAVRHGR
ncbi:RNA polymerase sigma factor [Robbsia andropogonis]|uniref:RNA polymerase sigma factor n=1 Tax=Robbsia andropogonis TaxID=28092 RepID=UPI0009E64DF3|nr:RNA polymerase sigma factor [Robbsia andropogonis]